MQFTREGGAQARLFLVVLFGEVLSALLRVPQPQPPSDDMGMTRQGGVHAALVSVLWAGGHLSAVRRVLLLLSPLGLIGSVLEGVVQIRLCQFLLERELVVADRPRPRVFPELSGATCM